jgi:hypothetical protein
LKKVLTEEEIREYDQRMRAQHPGFDTFFVSSAAYDIDISKRTLQNYIYKANPDFSFIKLLLEPEVPDGGIATCQSSTQACSAKRTENDGRKKLETYRTNFPNVRTSATSYSPITVSSSGSVGS